MTSNSQQPPHAVAILGAGFGGLGMASQLKKSGENSFVILEKAGRVGGTWRDNVYPGCACDVPSHLYWYSFEEQPDWSHIFSPQPEILRNLELFVERHNLAAHIRFHSEAVTARWDDAAAVWRIQMASGEEVTARALIAAWGQLNRPKLPEIEGRDSFGGIAFHSAQWRQEICLEDTRVGCIGNGASAAQIIPEIAPKAVRLTVFQRSASYIVPRMDRAYTEDERRTFTTDPGTIQADREAMYLDHESRYEAMRPGSSKAAEFLAIARAHLESQVSDLALREKLWPDYALGCKRILVSDDFYPAMARPNVDLVTERIARIERAGVRTGDGRLHEVDVLIYSTGFETTFFLGSMEICGRSGRSLREQWREGASAYLGIAVSNFPNFFLLYGPNTNLGHNSIIAMLECQFRYILEGLSLIEQRSLRALDVRAEAMQRFNRELQEELKGTAWAAGCSSWYKTADGQVTNNWCGTVEQYKARTARIEIDDYDLLTC